MTKEEALEKLKERLDAIRKGGYGEDSLELKNLARKAGLCVRCELGLLCLPADKLPGKAEMEVFLAKVHDGDLSYPASDYATSRMLCKQDKYITYD